MPLHQVVNVCSCVVHVELPLSVMYKYVRAYLINLTHHIYIVHVELPLSVMYKYVRAYLINLTHHIYNIIVHVELALSVVYVCVQVP